MRTWQHVRVQNHEQVVGVVLRRLGEVERAGDDRLAVDYHDLVVGDGMLSINEAGDAVVVPGLLRPSWALRR